MQDKRYYFVSTAYIRRTGNSCVFRCSLCGNYFPTISYVTLTVPYYLYNVHAFPTTSTYTDNYCPKRFVCSNKTCITEYAKLFTLR